MSSDYIPLWMAVNEGRITKKFIQFHRDNPWIYKELRKMAMELHAAGHERYGMKGLFEVLRWKQARKTAGSEFKLNNNYTALYARLLMHREPSLKEFFATREHSAQVIE